MENFFEFIHGLIVLLMTVGGLAGITYLCYLSWFRPSDFFMLSAGKLKGNGSLTNYYRKLFSSLGWLWITRLTFLVFVFLIGALIFHIILNSLGVVP